jgi:ATP-dependent helicase/nuclease subunit A
MRTPAAIPADVLRLQSEVSSPDVSAFVAANAGSGKTHVLAQRVVNLLLEGVNPEKILCLTFTKAAAANMAKRVFDTLAHWTTLDDAALDQALADCSDPARKAARRVLARQLFARALETPGGLKVQTIHAFCTRLLHQFPFEANVGARFSVLDEAEQTQLLEELTLAVLLDGAGRPESALGQALANAMMAAADQTFRDLIRETIRQRDAIMASVRRAGSVGAAIAGLSLPLGIDPSDTRQNGRRSLRPWRRDRKPTASRLAVLPRSLRFPAPAASTCTQKFSAPPSTPRAKSSSPRRSRIRLSLSGSTPSRSGFVRSLSGAVRSPAAIAARRSLPSPTKC